MPSLHITTDWHSDDGTPGSSSRIETFPADSAVNDSDSKEHKHKERKTHPAGDAPENPVGDRVTDKGAFTVNNTSTMTANENSDSSDAGGNSDNGVHNNNSSEVHFVTSKVSSHLDPNDLDCDSSAIESTTFDEHTEHAEHSDTDHSSHSEEDTEEDTEENASQCKVLEDSSLAKEDEVADNAPSTKEDEVADNAPLTKEDEVDDHAPLTKEDEVADNAPLTKEDEVADNAPLTKEDEVTDNAPSTKGDEVDVHAPLTKEDEVDDHAPLTKEDEVADNAPSTKGDEVVDNTPSTKDDEVADDAISAIETEVTQAAPSAKKDEFIDDAPPAKETIPPENASRTSKIDSVENEDCAATVEPLNASNQEPNDQVTSHGEVQSSPGNLQGRHEGNEQAAESKVVLDDNTDSEETAKEDETKVWNDEVDSVLSSMIEHANDTSLVKECCRSLWRLVVLEAEELNETTSHASRLLQQEKQALPRLFKVMWTQMYSKPVIEAAVGLLATLARSQPNVEALSSASCELVNGDHGASKQYFIEDLVMSSMFVHKNQVGIQIKCCSIIHNTVDVANHMVNRWTQRDAVKMVLDAIVTHPRSSELHIRACSTVAAFANKSSDARDALVSHGVIGVLRGMLISALKPQSPRTKQGDLPSPPSAGVPKERRVTPTAKTWKNWAGTFLEHKRNVAPSPRLGNGPELSALVNVVLCTVWNLAQSDSFRLDIAFQLVNEECLLESVVLELADTELFLGMLWNLSLSQQVDGKQVLESLFTTSVFEALTLKSQKVTSAWPSKSNGDELYEQCSIIAGRLLSECEVSVQRQDALASGLDLLSRMMSSSQTTIDILSSGMKTLSYLLEKGCQYQQLAERDEKAKEKLEIILTTLSDAHFFSVVSLTLHRCITKGSQGRSLEYLVSRCLSNLVKFASLKPSAFAKSLVSDTSTHYSEVTSASPSRRLVVRGDMNPADESSMLHLVIKSMSTFLESSEIQSLGCSLLWSAASGTHLEDAESDTSSTSTMAQSASLSCEDAIITALEAHKSNRSVCTNAVGALWVLAARNDSCRQRLVAADMVAKTLELVCVWGLAQGGVEAKELVAQLVSLLWWLSCTGGGLMRLGQSPLVPKLGKVVTACSNGTRCNASHRIAAGFLGILHNLVVGSAATPCSPKRSASRELGKLVAIGPAILDCLPIGLLETRSDEAANLVHTGLKVITVLSRQGEFTRSLSDVRAITWVYQVLCNFTGNEQLMGDALGLLWKQLSTQEGRVAAKRVATSLRQVITNGVMAVHRKNAVVQRLSLRNLSALATVEAKSDISALKPDEKIREEEEAPDRPEEPVN